MVCNHFTFLLGVTATAAYHLPTPPLAARPIFSSHRVAAPAVAVADPNSGGDYSIGFGAWPTKEQQSSQQQTTTTATAPKSERRKSIPLPRGRGGGRGGRGGRGTFLSVLSVLLVGFSFAGVALETELLAPGARVSVVALCFRGAALSASQRHDKKKCSS